MKTSAMNKHVEGMLVFLNTIIVHYVYVQLL